MQKKSTQVFEKGNPIDVCEGLSINCASVVKPISVYGDLIGVVIVLGDDVATDTEKMLAELTALFVGKYLEA